MNNETRFFVDSIGTSIEPLIGSPRPAVWMRAARNQPTLGECCRLRDISAAGAELFLWRTSRLEQTENQDGRLAQLFRRFPWLKERCLHEDTLPAQTGITKEDIPSCLLIAQGNDCAEDDFGGFVRDSNFGKLSGVIFGCSLRVVPCAQAFAEHLQNWKTCTRRMAEMGLLRWIDRMQELSLFPVLCVTDSNMRCYWVVPTAGALSCGGSIHPSELAGTEEFASWSAIGWDIKGLQRTMFGEDL